MTPKEILEFINKNMSCTLATCLNNKPHVRGMWMYRADEKGIIFHTGVMRDLYKQLRSQRPFLKPIVAQHGPDSIAVFRVKEMAATVWSMAKNLEPKECVVIK